MAFVETERHGQTLVVRMNRPERLNALGRDLRLALAEAWRRFRDDDGLEVAIFTGTGRAFCAGEDMKESLERGSVPGDSGNAPASIAGSASARPRLDNPYDEGTLAKPVITAINGYAMGGGFQLAERGDLRVAVRGAIFEMSEAKRWLLGGFAHGLTAAMPHAIATEMAFAYRFSAERLCELGWLNRLTEPDELIPTAKEMAAHLMTLPPASRVNTLAMMHSLRPQPSEEIERLAAALRGHGALDDLMESRRAFAEKRAPNFRGWDDPADRDRTPTLDSIRST